MSLWIRWAIMANNFSNRSVFHFLKSIQNLHYAACKARYIYIYIYEFFFFEYGLGFSRRMKPMELNSHEAYEAHGDPSAMSLIGG